MQIESKIQRAGGSHITIGKTDYHFAPQDDGAHVATVTDEAHQDRFLSITEGYRLYRPGQAPAVATPVVVLLGSGVHDPVYSIGGKDYALGDLVALAHTASGLDAEEWNGLEAETRAGLIDEQLDLIAAAVPAPVPTGDEAPITPEEDERVTLAAQYKAKTGNAPHYSWDADKIRAKLAE